MVGSASAWGAELTITEAWVRAPVGHQKSSGVFLNIVSPVPQLIVGARADVAERVDLVEMLVADSGPMRPHKVEEIRLVAKEKNYLTPVTHYLMLAGLRRPLVAGEHIAVVLELEAAGHVRSTATVDAVVKPFYEGNR
nr:copper chaperone PCu(A)C [Uliginosibacterium gangwonense]